MARALADIERDISALSRRSARAPSEAIDDLDALAIQIRKPPGSKSRAAPGRNRERNRSDISADNVIKDARKLLK